MEKLIPYAPHGGAFVLSGFLSFAKGRLHVKFELRDPKREVVGAPVNGTHDGASVTRADNLWQATCFEAFFGEEGKPGYWELNVAPSGTQWNLYRFDGYRVPQPPVRSEDFSLERITVRDGVVDCVLQARVPVGKIDASLCAVIRTGSDVHYYALSHAGAKADFHLRSSFCVTAG